MRHVKSFFTLLGLLLLALTFDWFGASFFWNKMNVANTSFMANLYGACLFVLVLITNGPLVLGIIFEREYWYKKSHTYNPHRRKWEKNK